jgi:histone deacetylase 11
VIYNAGTDILAGDPLGNLNISAKGVIARDETIFRLCLSRNIPLIMVLSGGYQKVNAEVISLSIQNIYSQFG